MRVIRLNFPDADFWTITGRLPSHASGVSTSISWDNSKLGDKEGPIRENAVNPYSYLLVSVKDPLVCQIPPLASFEKAPPLAAGKLKCDREVFNF